MVEIICIWKVVQILVKLNYRLLPTFVDGEPHDDDVYIPHKTIFFVDH